ncbi:hypothetical protein ScPMuIL_003998 [Solemya velum]
MHRYPVATLKKCILIVGVATVVLHIAGFVSPGWHVVDYNVDGDGVTTDYLSESISQGLWYGVHCETIAGEYTCGVYSHGEYADYLRSRLGGNHPGVINYDVIANEWIDLSIEATFALILCCVCLVIIIFRIRPPETYNKMWCYAAAFTSGVSAILICIPVVELIKVHRTLGLIERAIGAVTTYTPYSLILSGLGGDGCHRTSSADVLYV